ncbi:MAG: hypothetical protein PQJ59_13630 [Spirochaetales bacterium]|nr:hypothetical protein [Spirochaetales bacterium]
MKKISLITLSAALGILLLFVLRFASGPLNRRSLFPRYEEENITTIACPEEGWKVVKGPDAWLYSYGAVDLPVEEEELNRLLRIPKEAKRHEVGLVDSDWFPGESTGLVYTDNKGKELSLTFYYDSLWAGRLLFSPDAIKAYLLPNGDLSLVKGEYLSYQGILPREMEGDSIIYYSLDTAREGAEAVLYQYKLIQDGGLWSCESELPVGALKEEAVHLLLHRLADLEGDLLFLERDFDRSQLRFRVEVRDYRGNRLVLEVGERIEWEGSEYYLARVEGEEMVYAMTRENLAGIAPSLQSLMDL